MIFLLYILYLKGLRAWENPKGKHTFVLLKGLCTSWVKTFEDRWIEYPLVFNTSFWNTFPFTCKFLLFISNMVLNFVFLLLNENSSYSLSYSGIMWLHTFYSNYSEYILPSLLCLYFYSPKGISLKCNKWL